MSKKKKTRTITPEWSHKIDVRDTDKGPVKVHIEASEEQRRDLARRLDVSAIEMAQADLVLKREKHVIQVTGTFQARLTQACVVTLKPVEDIIEEPLEAWFSEEEQVVSLARQRRERQSLLANAELQVLEDKEEPEAVQEGHIDVGELVTQHMSLAVNPYPHAEGVVFEPAAVQNRKKQPDSAGTRPNPFAALKEWKFNKDGKK